MLRGYSCFCPQGSLLDVQRGPYGMSRIDYRLVVFKTNISTCCTTAPPTMVACIWDIENWLIQVIANLSTVIKG